MPNDTDAHTHGLFGYTDYAGKRDFLFHTKFELTDRRCFESCRGLNRREIGRLRTCVSGICNPPETWVTVRPGVCRRAGDHVTEIERKGCRMETKVENNKTKHRKNGSHPYLWRLQQDILRQKQSHVTGKNEGSTNAKLRWKHNIFCYPFWEELL